MTNDNSPSQPVNEKSFFQVIVHSFFVIPFLIAVFCLLLFTAINLLTREKRTAYDYLEDVKTGGATKRWQGAFELSKILANPQLLPKETRFTKELAEAFKKAVHDDNRVRQYLALAMGRTGRSEFVPVLLEGLKEEKLENIPALTYALGALRDKSAAPELHPLLSHPDARVRSMAVTALGTIGNPESKPALKKVLNDIEPNAQWGAAISLAQMKDPAGLEILLKILNRQYLAQFPEVDPEEQDKLILAVIEASKNISESSLKTKIKELSETDQNMNIRSAALATLR